MTIYADSRGGSLIIERRFHGRRFRQATGLPSTPQGRKTAEAWEHMLLALLEGGRSELVWAIGKSLTFHDLWPHYRTGAWSRMPSPEHMAPLFDSVRSWLPTAHKARGAPISEVHRRTLESSFKALERLRPRATVADVPDLLRAYRVECEKRGIGRTFRKAKNAAQAFLRETLGKRRSMLWAEVSDIPDVAYSRSVTQAVSVARLVEIRSALPPAHAAIWWALCCSGMMPDELWGHKWRVEGAGLAVGGTKTAYRRRVVPLIVVPKEPERLYKAFRVALQKVDESLTPYVARRSYGHWLEEAGINPTRRRLYMGHAAKDPHEQYPEHDVVPHLADDAALFTGCKGFEVMT